ncbi:hypothetical protein D3C87_1235880 [compost metagenome]
MNNKLIFLSVFAFFGNATAANLCPPPRNAVKPEMSVSVKYDSKSKLYKYQYTIKNGATAQVPVDYFGLYLNEKPKTMSSPSNWGAEFLALDYLPSNLTWTTVAVADGNKITGDSTVPAPLYAIKPGKSLQGFEITSLQPPGVVQFFAEGFSEPPTSTATADNNEPTPECPGWSFGESKLQTQVSGMTTGPSEPDTISLKIRARDESGQRVCRAIEPKKPTGKISVLVMSNSNFDASQIDLATIVFGPGYAKPTSNKLVQTGIGEQLDKNDFADWESSFDSFLPDRADRKKLKFKNLLLTFEVADLDVQCNLDQSLFLRGKTKQGMKVLGAVAAHVAGCGAKDYGRHKKHKIPFK